MKAVSLAFSTAVSLAFSTILAGSLAFSTPAFAEGCKPLAQVRTENESHGRKWEELSVEQWYFLAGVYALFPGTPAGLPFGNKAVLITESASNMGVVLFIDGPLACVPMPIPEDILKELREVGVKINHAGAL